MPTVPGSAKDLKIGRFVVVEGEPCKILEIQTSSPGKHGASKLRITAVGLFDNTKKVFLKPGDGNVEVPIVERKTLQVITVSGGAAQVMNPKTYEMIELPIPEELKGVVEAGKEVEVIETMGRILMQRVK